MLCFALLARGAFQKQLEDAENWLYDHWDEELEVYVAELDTLTAVVRAAPPAGLTATDACEPRTRIARVQKCCS